MVEVTDADAARSFLQRVLDQDPSPDQRRTYQDTQYFSSGGGFAAGVINDQALVIGTETAFKVAVDSAAGESLSESEEYTDRIDALPNDTLATAFFEPASAIEAAIASEGLDSVRAQALEPLLGGPLSQPVAASLSATPDAASLDISAMVDSGSSLGTESSLLAGLPGGSWFAIAVPDLGETLARGLDQLASSGLPGAGELQRRLHAATGLDLSDDVFSWLGDAAAFVQGTGVPGFSAGLIAETTDPEAPRALLEAGRRVAERESGLRSSGPPEGADYGFSIGLPGVGGGAEAGVVGDELVAVVGATASQALEPDETLGDNERLPERGRPAGRRLRAEPVHRPALVLHGRRGGFGRRHRLRDAASLPGRVRKSDRRQQCRRPARPFEVHRLARVRVAVALRPCRRHQGSAST